MAVYIVDSNFFIQAYRSHYPFDVVPGFWDKIKQLAEKGIIISIDKVRDELYANKDELTSWCQQNLPIEFFKDTTVCISEYAEITQWAISLNFYTQQALNEFLDTEEADAWLISYSKLNGDQIVTHEIKSNSKNRIKIPDVCEPFNVKCVNTIEMFRQLGESF
jgi:hypothetical protein